MKVKSPVIAAQGVLHNHGMAAAPIDVEAICKKEGIACHRVDLRPIEMEVGRQISGLIQRYGEGKYVILVNEMDIEPRRRFTIAHELGHFFLHMDDAPEGDITSFRGDRSHRETQADTFAAELLMPEPLVRAAHDNLVIPVADRLAKVFNVSRQAMAIRLERLGLRYV